MFFNELKVLVFMRSDSRQSGSDTERRSTTMRGLGMGGCGWPPFVDCHSRDDEEEYYGSDPRPRSLAFEDKEPKLQVGLDAVSLASTASSLRTPQCRICFQGPEQVDGSRVLDRQTACLFASELFVVHELFQSSSILASWRSVFVLKTIWVLYFKLPF